jgi:hypothetical protein
MPSPHWMGQAIDKMSPTRLVHGAASICAARWGGTITHVLQTTASAIKHTVARPTLKVIVNKGLWRGSLSGAADWSSAVASHGMPSNAQRRSPILG